MNSAVSVDLARATASLDLEWRLKNTPANARSRGIFFVNLRKDMARRGLDAVPELRRLLDVPRTIYNLYPTRDLIEAMAFAAALVNPDPREGLRELFNPTAHEAKRSWFGAAFARYLTPAPDAALRWLERSHSYMANYGTWRVESRGEGHAVLHMTDQYFWLDALRGGCEGMLVTCGVRGEVALELDSPFDGRLVARWTKPG